MGLLLASCRAAGLGKICKWHARVRGDHNGDVGCALNTNAVGGDEEEEQSAVLHVLERAKEKRDRAEARGCELIKNICDQNKEMFEKDDENKIFSFIAECKQNIIAVMKSLGTQIHACACRVADNVHNAVCFVVSVEAIEADYFRDDDDERDLRTREKYDLENVVLRQELMTAKVLLFRA